MDPRLTNSTLKTSLQSLLDLLLPRECHICGCTLLPQESFVCLCCLVDMPRTYFAKMEHNPMADKFNSKIAVDTYESYSRATALFIYDGQSNYRYIPMALKYRRDIAAGRFFAKMLAVEIESSHLYADVDLVVPVPLHWMRRLKRGYNQAEVIAREISKLLKVRCDASLLLRSRRTTTQTRLSGEAKTSNVRGAFRVNSRRAQRLSRQLSRAYRVRSNRGDAVAPHHILLVDDVFTSGATTAACFAPLRAYFGSDMRISVATLAYVAGD